MSTAQPAAGQILNEPADPPPQKVDHLVVYGHANLFYWWPVWLVSFILAGVTYAEGQQMAVVPRDAVVEHDVLVSVNGVSGKHDVIVAPTGKTFARTREEGQTATPGMTVSGNNSLGVIFVGTLVLVALASTILLRGLVSLVAVVLMVTAVVTWLSLTCGTTCSSSWAAWTSA